MNKLRTVLWGFAGQRVPDDLVAALQSLSDALTGSLSDRMCRMLGESERDALSFRTTQLLESKTHPLPPTDRPAVPWPMW